MALIIEDGTIVTGSNSYVTIVETKDYALERGITLGEDAVVENQLILAKDYLESKRSEYQGSKTNAEIDGTPKTQPLQWPRTDVYIDRSTVALDVNTIPTELKYAQMQLVIEQFNDVELFAVRSGKFIIDERVGPLIVKYSEGGGTDTSLEMTAVDTWLTPLFSTYGNFGSMTTIKI